MKTNQIMIRDNEAFVQRTKDGYFSATTLVNHWNIKNPTSRKDLSNYKNNGSVVLFINQLIEEGIEKPIISSKINGTWVHPKLIIDIAMWVSVEFKSIVLDYVLDGLINSRHDAGNYYNEMCATILKSHYKYWGTKPNPTLYIIEARNIRKLLKLDNKDRNQMTEQELNNITTMQKLNSLLLSKGTGKAARSKQLELQAEVLLM